MITKISINPHWVSSKGSNMNFYVVGMKTQVRITQTYWILLSWTDWKTINESPFSRCARKIWILKGFHNWEAIGSQQSEMLFYVVRTSTRLCCKMVIDVSLPFHAVLWSHLNFWTCLKIKNDLMPNFYSPKCTFGSATIVQCFTHWQDYFLMVRWLTSLCWTYRMYPWGFHNCRMWLAYDSLQYCFMQFVRALACIVRLFLQTCFDRGKMYKSWEFWSHLAASQSGYESSLHENACFPQQQIHGSTNYNTINILFFYSSRPLDLNPW